MAITTIFDGIEYRSRLESRWAAFFSNIGWHTTYEPFDGDGYIPDFLVHGERPMLVEVKPASSEKDYYAPISKIEHGLSGIWDHDVLIVGADPLPYLPNSFDFSNHPAGVLGEWEEASWQWATANWMICTVCIQISVFHDFATYQGRPCGHYHGDSYIGGLRTNVIREAWADACNAVKWRGRAA